MSGVLVARSGGRRRSVAVVSASVVLSLVASLLQGVPAAAAPSRPHDPAGPSKTSVPVGKAKTRPATRSATDGPGLTAIDHATLPKAATADVTVSDPPVSVGGLPVRLGRIAGGPSTVRVRVADRSAAKAAGVHGVVLSLARSDKVAASGRVHVWLDYSSFANAYGGDYGNRLRLVGLPACALTTPDKPECQRQSDLGSVNAGGTVSADVVASGDTTIARPAGTVSSPTVVALDAGSSSAGATFAATSLSPAYSWSAGGQGGSFTENYPLRVPPSIGGPEPDLDLQYDSASVDAQTLAQNGQTSWVGEGWDLQVGYIERSYRSCNLDGGSTSDLCWFSGYNATMVFKGQSTMLVHDNSTGVWHAADDSGMKIEQLFDTSKGNGDNDGEHWRVTTRDGVQYYFGANKRYAGDPASTNSVLTEPVYGNNAGEPCYNATFASAWCQQGYRWNLDYVVDPSGNSMTYFYTKFSGYYGQNNNTSVAPYDITGALDHIDYGTRAGSEGSATAPMQVWLVKANRCINACGQNTSDYPETPWDLYCSSTTSCPSLLNPVFFTPYKLSTVYTQVWDLATSAYRKVDQWDLTHTYPPSGDYISPAGNDTSPNLWLQTLTHTGYATGGAALAEPAMTFGGTQMFNRVDWGNDIGVAPYVHYRLTSIVNGIGGQTQIAYSPTECTRTFKPSPEANPYRCFPQYFKPQLAAAGWGWFHKYVTTQITDQDLTGGSPDEVWSYTYSAGASSDPALWHHDYTETTTLAYRSWPLWRGYTSVTTTHGPSSGPQTVTTSQYYRGMDGDGMSSTDNSAMVWNSRRVGITTPLGTPGTTSAISGQGTKCLDINGYGTANGTNVQLWDCTGAWNQVWQPQSNGSLKNPQSGKCLDISGYGTANGTNVQLWDCTGNWNQVWQRQPDGSLRNPNSGRCLDISGWGTANGTNVQLWDCSGTWNQVWQPPNDGSLTNPQAGRCADINNGGTANGTKIQSWACNGTGAQVWQQQSNGSVKNPSSGKCMDVTGGGTANGTLVQLYDCNGTGAQVWQPQADGSLKNLNSGRCLEAGSSPASGNQLVIWDCTGTITQKWAARLTDADGAQGFLREKADFDGSTAAESTIRTPTVTQTAIRSAPVSGGQDVTAHMVTDTDTQTRTWLPVSSTWRWTETQTSYDTYGLATDVKDLGDTSISSDDTCTHTDYARNTTGTTYLIDFPSQKITTDCVASLGDADYVNGEQTLYDGSATVGAAPVQGLATRTNDLAAVSGGSFTWRQNDRTDYDANGRETAKYDALDRRTATAYTPAAGAPVTQTVETDPMGWTKTINLDPGHELTTSTVDVNGKVTTAQYDPLGRLTAVWANNRSTSGTPDVQYTYTLSGSSPNWIQTQKLGPTGAQITSYSIFDGQTRLRQVQTSTPVANGGRMIADTAYDGRGLKAKTSTFYNGDSGPSSTLVTFADTAVPTQDRHTYDNLERETVDAFYSLGSQQWQTTKTYQGDRAAEIPPAGGITTQKILDARGNTTELRQFTSTNLSGSYQATSYTYDRENKLTRVTDPAGNTWTWTLDLRGRTVARTDPDSGTTTSTYDDADELLTTTDARPVTLAYTYDNLGRKTNEYLNSTSGPLLASWTYDTVAKGQLTSSTSYVGADAYTTTVTGYDDAYRRLGTSVALPASEGTALAGPWTTSTTYNVDGSTASTTYPAAGGLGAETVNYSYDANGFQLTAAGLDTYVSATAYQPWGDVYQRTLGTGTKHVQLTTDEWADTRRTKTITTATENQTTPGTYDEQLTQKYNWTPAGTVSSIDNQHAGATTDSQCFSYDYLQRLTTAFTTTPALGGCTATPSTSTVGGPDAYWQTYGHDPAGNRTSLVSHGLGGAGDTTATYTYPAAGTPKAHTLSSVNTTGPSGSSANTYTYGAVGEQANATVNGLSTDYALNSQGKLQTATIHATGGDQAVTYLYDTDGNELLRKTATGKTLYLGSTEINTNAVGDTLTSVTRYYTCNDTTIASRNDPGTLSWLAEDHQDTAQVAVDAATLAVSIRKQDPFGNPRGTVPTWPNSRGFVGGTNEPTGLIHLGARMYDPTTGRFTADDPVTDTDNPQQLNGYAYAYNSPITFSDPDGLWGFHSFFKAVATVASVASIIPGPIGMIAAGVSAISYAAAGDWTNAGIMAAGIALSAVGAGAAVLAVKAVRVVREVRAIRSGVTAIENAGRTARTLVRAGRAVSRGAGYVSRGLGRAQRAVAYGGRYIVKGYETKLGKNWRIAPFGNRKGKWYNWLPHYHRRGSGPGQGIGRHRPWQNSRHDQHWWNRF
jgi:RHS repeat-associated protein